MFSTHLAVILTPKWSRSLLPYWKRYIAGWEGIFTLGEFFGRETLVLGQGCPNNSKKGWTLCKTIIAFIRGLCCHIFCFIMLHTSSWETGLYCRQASPVPTLFSYEATLLITRSECILALS